MYDIEEILNMKEREYTITVKVEFIPDVEWENWIKKLYLENKYYFDRVPKEKYLLFNINRARELMGKIYLKESAKKDKDFPWLLLHEMGHAVCNLEHTETKGSLMHPDSREWFK